MAFSNPPPDEAAAERARQAGVMVVMDRYIYRGYLQHCNPVN
ncbi:MAG: hypothetical protein OQK94_06385 [Gammaproteobacteria bacterium]|nr:hypothetical protein [Gammaproteobacteria bacterium]MCW8840760.1 hypothetical protein [Gammaproteobacteria bacterium]MCW8928585.1 hypothetical protein [Gammaproteobacteria bacterium]MCW8958343.1 hypothetical protein [Gammaproteobacteria bacterium]MCW8972603.1 hypothetical protein [Gammaproteobacteria bacterium]